MGRIIEFGSMLFLGMLLILAMTHFLNGTLLSWVGSKFIAGTPQQVQAEQLLSLKRAWLKQYQAATTPQARQILLDQWNSGTWKP